MPGSCGRPDFHADVRIFVRIFALVYPGLGSGFLGSPGLDLDALAPPELDSGFLAPPGLDSGFMAPLGLDSGFLVHPGVDSGFLAHPGASRLPDRVWMQTPIFIVCLSNFIIVFGSEVLSRPDFCQVLWWVIDPAQTSNIQFMFVCLLI